MTFDFKKLLPHLVAVIVFILAGSFYFLPQFSGKKVVQSDIQQFQGMASEIKEYQKKGETILWTNSMFGGMPTFQIAAPAKKNISRHIEKTLGVFFKRPAAYFIVGMLAFYLALLVCNVNSWIALIGSFVFAFGTNNMVLFEAGHTSKIRVLMVSVLIVAGVIQVMRKKYATGATAYAIGMALSFYGNHIQMTYYLAIVMGIYALVKSIDLIIKKDYKHLLTSMGILILMTIISIGTSASKIWTTYEYQKTTMRGKPILENTSAVSSGSSSATQGLAWDYAMTWSNSFKDLVAMYIPRAAGGGSSEKISKNSATNKFLRRARANSIPYGPMYHGKVPFTSGPQYLGAITFLLFFISLFVVKPVIRIWGIAAFIVTIVMSMGNNISWINQPLFDNLPLLNKFRSPSSITSVTAIFVAFIAFLGMNRIFEKSYLEKNRNTLSKIILGVTGILSAICLYYTFIGPSVTDFTGVSDFKYADNPAFLDAIREDRASLMRSDSLRTLLFTLLAGGLLWAFVKEKINKWIAIGVIGLLLVIDLWGVDMRYLNHDSFQSARKIENSLKPRPVDDQINKDKDLHFRVHDITTDPFQSTTASLHNKTIGGYHAAKLQRFADIIDRYLLRGNQNVLNMLNTKYFITGQGAEQKVQQNGGAFGNAWFVSNVQKVSTANEEIEAIGNVNGKSTAIIHNDFNLSSNSFSNAGSINLVSYHPDKLVYKSNNSGNGLALFSEVWYGGNGWNAYIDGKKVNIVRANYILRALEIPAGSHEITFEFKPKSYYLGETISLISSVLLLLILGGAIYMGIKSVS